MGRRIISTFILISIFTLLFAGCDEKDPTVSMEDEINQRLTQTVAALETANAASGGEGAGEADLAATQTAQALAQSQMAEATLAAQMTASALEAQATAQAEAQMATATAQAPIVAELPLYDVDPSNGHLGWVHRPVSLRAEGYRSDEFANDYIQMPVADFVMAADITWNSKYGDSGCGFILRSDGNPEAPSQYIVLISRSATGHAYYLAQVKGEVFNFRNWYGNIRWRNDSTNRLAVVARGPILKVYTNNVLVGEIDTSQPPPPLPQFPKAPEKPPGILTPEQQAAYDAAVAAYNQLTNLIKRYHTAAVRAFNSNDAVYEQGLVGMFAFAYSGYINCDYDNAWLWVIDN
jgi:hypothetical protein